MVVLSQPALGDCTIIQTCNAANFLTEIPVVDLSDSQAKSLIVEACQQFGTFKVVNHGVPLEFMTCLENEALKFFNLSQSEKDRAGPTNPFGYGSKRIGVNGDMGWVEYLLLNTNPNVISPKSLFVFQNSPEIFHSALNNYVLAVKKMSCELLEWMADGLEIEPKNVFSKLISDAKTDSCFRLNYYPPCSELQLQALSGLKLIGFGEHTDPQLISVLRSNNTSGLEICLNDGTWVSVPPDPASFFINVGDALQVMTNGRFRSVKHRVMADAMKSRVSMIYFGGPPLNEKIAPLPSLMAEEEESLYKEFTWCEYKTAAYKTRLADNRLAPFEKSATN